MAKIPCPECDKPMRTHSGLDWHLEHIHGENGAVGGQGTQIVEAEAEAPVQSTTPDSTDHNQWAEDIGATLEEIQRQVDSLNDREEAAEPTMVMLYDLIIRVEGLEAQVAYLPQVRRLVEGLVKDRGSMRRYDADTEITLRAVCRILFKLENPERTGFGKLADDAACGITLEEARDLLK